MDKSKRRRRRENEELRLLVFVLSYSNYELGLYGIRLVDRLIESFPMLIRHVARRKQRHAGPLRSPWSLLRPPRSRTGSVHGLPGP